MTIVSGSLFLCARMWHIWFTLTLQGGRKLLKRSIILAGGASSVFTHPVGFVVQVRANDRERRMARNFLAQSREGWVNVVNPSRVAAALIR
jgi:hypothetical protein